MGFCYGRPAPDPYGGKGKYFPWFQVVRELPGGATTLIVDFLGSMQIASLLAIAKNLRSIDR